MGCLFSVISAIFKIAKLVIKTAAKILVAVIMFLIKIGLLLPLVYVCVGFGLWVGGTEWMTPGTTGFVIYLVGLALLTLVCLWLSLKKVMQKHNDKYDENGKRIRK
ncbi:MAG: hypothetical protein IKA90_03915 [Clostridia bacterium]|nr:hypothetical protein [Clostridia bacterium]